MRPIVIPDGHRVYVLGRRIHHGLAGAVFIAVGALLALHDRADFPWRLRDRD